jgi:hypothetical protein
MRKFLYLAVTTTIIFSGAAFLVQSRLHATGATGPRLAVTISPLDIHGSMDVLALPTQEIADLF